MRVWDERPVEVMISTTLRIAKYVQPEEQGGGFAYRVERLHNQTGEILLSDEFYRVDEAFDNYEKRVKALMHKPKPLRRRQ